MIAMFGLACQSVINMMNETISGTLQPSEFTLPGDIL